MSFKLLERFGSLVYAADTHAVMLNALIGVQHCNVIIKYFYHTVTR